MADLKMPEDLYEVSECIDELDNQIRKLKKENQKLNNQQVKEINLNIWQITKELGLKKYNDSQLKDGYGYKGVISTGNFTCINDYGIGLLCIDIKNPSKLTYPIITITTIDEGVWQGYGDKNIDIDQLVKDFNNTFGVKLPSENEFNNFLNNYNIFGQYDYFLNNK
jgi:hypothetical protein